MGYSVRARSKMNQNLATTGKLRRNTIPLPVSTASASAKAWWASRGKLVNTIDADIVSGRSAPCSSSGIGAFPVLENWSEVSLRLDGRRWVGLGELRVEGILDDGELILRDVSD